MSRGPAPTPSYLQLLKGNPSKRPLNDREPRPAKGAVSPPGWLVELDVPVPEIASLKTAELRDLARRLDIARASRMKRGDLVQAIVDSSEGDRLRFWGRLQEQLVKMGVMTEADGTALALLCDNLATYIECRRVLIADGLTYDFTTKAGVEMPVQRPEVGIGNAALTNAMRLMDRFGLNPAYRTKLKVEAEREADGLDALRARGSNAAG
ncbi:MAG: hypothetical protein CVU47_06420 [Chloroflexi bacterium HGW-Chloroflexi-9]|nr:MAG: hypothetical protein CVU47_06420 [Chloroflexi bacterium HGW-Chloroflexi-9]